LFRSDFVQKKEVLQTASYMKSSEVIKLLLYCVAKAKQFIWFNVNALKAENV
jgi:hypothetical protein